MAAAGWVCDKGPLSKGILGNPIGMVPDSWDMHTFLFVQLQNTLNVIRISIKDSSDMHRCFFVQLIPRYPGNPASGCRLSLPVGTARGADCLLIRGNFQSR